MVSADIDGYITFHPHLHAACDVSAASTTTQRLHLLARCDVLSDGTVVGAVHINAVLEHHGGPPGPVQAPASPPPRLGASDVSPSYTAFAEQIEQKQETIYALEAQLGTTVRHLAHFRNQAEKCNDTPVLPRLTYLQRTMVRHVFAAHAAAAGRSDPLQVERSALPAMLESCQIQQSCLDDVLPGAAADLGVALDVGAPLTLPVFEACLARLLEKPMVSSQYVSSDFAPLARHTLETSLARALLQHFGGDTMSVAGDARYRFMSALGIDPGGTGPLGEILQASGHSQLGSLDDMCVDGEAVLLNWDQVAAVAESYGPSDATLSLLRAVTSLGGRATAADKAVAQLTDQLHAATDALREASEAAHDAVGQARAVQADLAEHKEQAQQLQGSLVGTQAHLAMTGLMWFAHGGELIFYDGDHSQGPCETMARRSFYPGNPRPLAPVGIDRPNSEDEGEETDDHHGNDDESDADESDANGGDDPPEPGPRTDTSHGVEGDNPKATEATHDQTVSRDDFYNDARAEGSGVPSQNKPNIHADASTEAS
eukprot:gene2799-557_t